MNEIKPLLSLPVALFTVTAILLLASCRTGVGGLSEAEVSESTPPPATFVSADEALTIVDDFLGGLTDPHLRGITSPELLCTNQDIRSLKGRSAYPSFYIVSLGRSGYAIVSADRFTPHQILGYSLDSSLDPTDLPCGLEYLLRGFGDQIELAREHSHGAVPTRYKQPKGTVVVAPLLGDINWNQSPHYNALCPDGTPVGCVATAISQIMRYWRYPERGEGTHTYRTRLGNQLLTLSADYDHTLLWEDMPEAPLKEPNAAIARFCYDVAVGVNMSFGYSGSGAMSPDVVPLVKNHYRYSKSARWIWREKMPLSDWEALVQDELKEGRPVFYCGHGTGGGHAFVCDGYDDSGYFHFNWGWAGMANGWYILDSLNPGQLGTGGGSGGYNSGQGIIVGLKPRAEVRGDEDKEDLGDAHEDEAPDHIRYYGFTIDKPEALFISRLRIGTLDSTSGASGYSDRTGLWLPARVGELPLDITISHLYIPLRGYVTIWMDLNHDGLFMKDERLLHQEERDGRVRSTLRIPPRTKPGDYRLRIALTTVPSPRPYGWLLYGEVEDYNLTVIE